MPRQGNGNRRNRPAGLVNRTTGDFSQ